MMDQKRVSVIEVLVVLLLVGLVGTFAAVAVNAARSMQRDAVRLSNVRQIQSAMENYFNEANAYPAGTGLPLGDSSQSACLGSRGFASDCSGDERVLLRVVIGAIDTGLDGAAVCGTPARNAFCYDAKQDGASYGIQFEMENALSQVGLAKGVNCATPEGMKAGKCQ